MEVEMEVKLEVKMEVEMEVEMDAPILPSTYTGALAQPYNCLLYTSPSPRDRG